MFAYWKMTEESYYRFCGELPDGSIVIVDGEGRYYHAEAGKEKRYIACLNPETQTENFKAAVSRLTHPKQRNVPPKSKRTNSVRKKRNRKNGWPPYKTLCRSSPD